MRATGKRGWIVAAGLSGAVTIGLIVGSCAVPADQPKSSASPSTTAIAIAPRVAPSPSTVALPVPKPSVAPRPVRTPRPAVPKRASPDAPDAVTVTTTNSW